MVLLLDYVVDSFHDFCHNLSLATPETVPFISSHYFELVVLEFLCEIVEVKFKLVLDLLAGQVAVGHHQSGVQTGYSQQSWFEVAEEHLLLQWTFEQELLG